MLLESAISEAIESQRRLLKGLIATPSFSKEERNTALMLAQVLEDLGHEVKVEGNNVICLEKSQQANVPWLLLNSHHDTVRPVEGYVLDPHDPQVEGGRLYGLGSNDAGASLVCLLHAFHLLCRNAERPYHLAFVASAEEEVSGAGGIASVVRHLPSIDFAVVGEPTKMQLAVAERGLMVVDGYAEGKAGHAARDEGENALYTAMEDIRWVRDHQFTEESPWLGKAKMTVTEIQAGTQHNVVPDLCKFTIDVRSTPENTNQDILNLLRENLKSRIEPRSMRLQPSFTPEDHAIVHRAKQLGLKCFGSPTLSDQALMPWPSAKIGPGDSARSHQANEYILLEEMEQGLRTYLALLDNLIISSHGQETMG